VTTELELARTSLRDVDLTNRRESAAQLEQAHRALRDRETAVDKAFAEIEVERARLRAEREDLDASTAAFVSAGDSAGTTAGSTSTRAIATSTSTGRSSASHALALNTASGEGYASLRATLEQLRRERDDLRRSSLVIRAAAEGDTPRVEAASDADIAEAGKLVGDTIKELAARYVWRRYIYMLFFIYYF
jgi:hypothetical protein